MKTWLKVFVVFFVLGFCTQAHCALVDIGSGVIFDDAADRYWYQDLSYFNNKNYSEQLSDIASLSVAPVSGHAWGAWRLASLEDMETLFPSPLSIARRIEIGEAFTHSYIRSPNTEQYIGRYENIVDPEPSPGPGHYMVGLEITPNPPGDPSTNFMFNSLEFMWELDTYRGINIGAWVVADACNVPIPGAVWLFGSGLIGLLGLRKKMTK